jgi:hypothetical protein
MLTSGDHQSTRLKRITYLVVPAFAYQFRDCEGGKGFWLQVSAVADGTSV